MRLTDNAEPPYRVPLVPIHAAEKARWAGHGTLNVGDDIEVDLADPDGRHVGRYWRVEEVDGDTIALQMIA